jgi:hypothetical protein
MRVTAGLQRPTAGFGRRRLPWASLVAALLLAAGAPGASVAATDEQIRACVEGNLVRYANPVNAVAAQYGDVETACIRALEQPGVSVQVDADEARAPGGPRTGERRAPDPPAGSAVPLEGDGTRRQPIVPGGGASDPDATRGAAGPPGSSDAALVRRAIEDPRATRASPLPDVTSASALWIAIVVGAMAIPVVAAVLARRSRMR